MVWLYRSPIPKGRRGVIYSFKWILTAVAALRRREGGGQHPVRSAQRCSTNESIWKNKCIITTLKKGDVLDVKRAWRLGTSLILNHSEEHFCWGVRRNFARTGQQCPCLLALMMQPISIHRWKAWRNYDQETNLKVVITYWNGAKLEMCVCGGGVTPSPLFPGATSLVFWATYKKTRGPLT